MSSSTFDIGLSGLLASQQGLATASHNIANVNTPGFSRQRVTFETRTPQFVGYGFTGKGADVQSIRRLSSDFLVSQLRNATVNQARAVKMEELVGRIDMQLGTGLVVGGVQNFFAALGDANDDPQLMATRQVLLENARAMVARFGEQESDLNGIARSVNQQVRGAVSEINALTAAIARLNIDISRGAGLASGEPPNDLLDRRDQLLLQLSELVGVQTQERGDGMVNVLLGEGQLVVTGGTAIQLMATTNPLDASRVEVSYDVGGTLSQITETLSGGQLGALLDFRDGVLEPTRSAIGRLAASIAMTVNEQHRRGMDLHGALGTDLFTVAPPVVNAAATNSGAVSVAFDTANIADLAASDYRLVHDGTNFSLTRLADMHTRTLSGAGPFAVDGLTITVDAPPAAGDAWLIQPTKFVPRSMQVTTSDPRAFALAGPVRTTTSATNLGDATIGRATVLDVDDPALLVTATLVFDAPPTSFRVNGAGPSIPWNSGDDIDLNGWRVQINGSVHAGDTFTVGSNAGGAGDNSNGLDLSALQFVPLMEGRSASYQEAYGMLVGAVGAAAQQARISREALSALAENAQAARDALSAVNLDEEAANLLRFQQTYQAAARVIAAADQAFQALIDATRR